MTTKLTLSVDSAIIAKARRISKHRRTSISVMFSHYIASLEDASSETPELPPITRRVLEMGAKLPTVPADWDYRSELNCAEPPLNAESIAALEEAKRIAADPNAKFFKSAGDLMKDVLSDSD